MLFVHAYFRLIGLERYLSNRNFRKLHSKVHKCSVSRCPPNLHTLEQICRAVDLACIWYWKRVLCLQRSAATVCLLRRYGVPARMVIGVQQTPFRAHAWVELEGRVVNDKPYMRELYAVLDET